MENVETQVTDGEDKTPVSSETEETSSETAKCDDDVSLRIYLTITSSFSQSPLNSLSGQSWLMFPSQCQKVLGMKVQE